MKIILTATDDALANAWNKYCGDLDFVEVYKGSIFDTKCDCVVSPNNSFSFMDGGIDYAYSQKFGWDLQKRVQDIIKTSYDGELLVGQAFIVSTNDKKIPFIVIAPTMRVPTILSSRTLNPYLAIRAALREAKKCGIESIAFPGMGTGVGKVSPRHCAFQMREAIDEVILELGMYPNGWQDALERHTFLCTGLETPFDSQDKTPFVES